MKIHKFFSLITYLCFILGCASIRYFEKDNLELQLSFGDNLLTNTVVNGKTVFNYYIIYCNYNNNINFCE